MTAGREPELWLIRHGATEWSRARRHTGRTDVPLTPDGEQAARALKPRLDGVSFDLVLASPLRRARETAELAGLSPQLEPLAQEWDYGEYEGATTPDVQAMRPGWSIWTSSVPGGETLEEVAGRADQVIARVRREAGRRAVLVAHAHFLRVLAVRWLGRPAGLAENFNLLTSTISVVAFDRGIPVIDRWNT
jgi:broad specificity phosphatase PhoE